jgi:translation initiation factor 1
MYGQKRRAYADAHMSTKKPEMPSPHRAGLGALAALRDQLPPGPTTNAAGAMSSTTSSADAPTTKPAPKGPARAVVRLDKKHRRGKTVTVIDKLELRPTELERWCRELKQALGCGGAVEDGIIILQGDLRDRVVALLTTRGVVRVSVAG